VDLDVANTGQLVAGKTESTSTGTDAPLLYSSSRLVEGGGNHRDRSK